MGDLVLVFTLKEFEAKFTKRGRGPYVISNLSSSGAVKLSTLKGEEIPNWISGCHIKKYNKSLTQNELNLLHQAKWRKARKQLEIELAQEEAKIRAQKRKLVLEKSKPMQMYKMKLLKGEDELEEETLQPIITIQIGEERLVTQAYIDSGVDRNTISYELYKKLKYVEL